VTATVADLVERLEPELGAAEGDPVALDGGITNRNYRIRLGGVDYVLRIAGKNTGLLGIDRETERRATQAAAEAGAAPAVAAFLEDAGCLVTRFVSGHPLEAAELRSPKVRAQLARSLRAVHAGPPLPTAFSPWERGRAYRAEAQARGVPVPAEAATAAAIAERVEAALEGAEPAPCHNDLMVANFIAGDERVWIVDWEYAGMGDRFYDLGNLAEKAAFSEDEETALLKAYLDAAPDAAALARLRLSRLATAYFEGMWGVVQRGLSDLDFDFAGYTTEHLDRVRELAADPRFERWLEDARA